MSIHHSDTLGTLKKFNNFQHTDANGVPRQLAQIRSGVAMDLLWEKPVDTMKKYAFLGRYLATDGLWLTDDFVSWDQADFSGLGFDGSSYSYRLAYGNGVLVFFSGAGDAYRSTNGIDWTASSTLTPSIRGLVFNGGYFWAYSVDTQTVAKSADGITWTQHATDCEITSLNDCRAGGGLIVITGTSLVGGTAWSLDGTNFTTVVDLEVTTGNTIGYNVVDDSWLVADGGNGFIWSGDQFATWQNRSTGASYVTVWGFDTDVMGLTYNATLEYKYIPSTGVLGGVLFDLDFDPRYSMNEAAAETWFTGTGGKIAKVTDLLVSPTSIQTPIAGDIYGMSINI